VMWRNTWLLLVDSVKLFYTVSAYKLNPIIFNLDTTKIDFANSI
jgi:hypothetical protein